MGKSLGGQNHMTRQIRFDSSGGLCCFIRRAASGSLAQFRRGLRGATPAFFGVADRAATHFQLDFLVAGFGLFRGRGLEQRVHQGVDVLVGLFICM